MALRAIILFFLLLSSSWAAGEYPLHHWLVGTGQAWYGHNIYGRQPLIIIGWQNESLDIKFIDMGIIGGNPNYRHARVLRAGYRLDPLVVGIYTSYNRQVDDRFVNYFSAGWYAGFKIDRPRYQIAWTYSHSLKDEEWSSHAEIVEFGVKF